MEDFERFEITLYEDHFSRIEEFNSLFFFSSSYIPPFVLLCLLVQTERFSSSSKKKNMEFLEVEERISPIDIVEEYNQYTQPASIADTYVVPDMVDGFLW